MGLSDKITHIAMKLVVTLEYEDEKQLSLQQVTFVFVAK